MSRTACFLAVMFLGSCSAKSVAEDQDIFLPSDQVVPNCMTRIPDPDWWTPPNDFPQECVADMDEKEHVVVRWDLAPEGGHPKNVRVTKTTNACFNQTARETVEKRIFGPTSSCDDGAVTEGLRAVFTYTRADND